MYEEPRWKEEPLEMAKKLREAADGWPIGYGDYRRAAAIIQSLVLALEDKIHETASLEPSE